MENHLDINSVLIYLAVFCLSLFFVKMSELYLYRTDGTMSKKRRRVIGILLLSFALFIPCFLTTIRGLDVGRDVGTYIIDNFNYGLSRDVSFWQFKEHVRLQIPEPLFAFVMYLCCKTGSIHFLFFVIESLILIPLGFVLVKNRGKGSLTLEFALYYFLFYNFSLSGMRQSIAMSLLAVAITFALNRELKKTIVFIIIAQLFHSSTILIVAIVLICYWVSKSKHKKLFGILFTLILLASFFEFSLYAGRVANIVARFNPRYGFFIKHYFHTGIDIGAIPSTDIVIKTLMVGIPFMIVRKNKRATFIDKLMMVFVLLGRYFVLFNGVFFEAMRIAYYFDLFIIIYIPRSLAFVRNRTNRLSYKIVYIGLAFLYWLYYIMYIGAYGTNLLTFNL